MRFSPDDVVCRVALNLGRVRTAGEALRAWLPLVSELQPVSAAFEAAHPDGRSTGTSPPPFGGSASLVPAPVATRCGPSGFHPA
ncbi:hypothetical protein ACIBRY_07805 [Streptomyces anulatus]